MSSTKQSEMIRSKWREIARGYVEMHLGDVAADYDDEESMADAMYDEVYTLAFDALHDQGVPDEVCRILAQELAQSYAQP